MGTPAFTQYFTSQELTDLYQEVMEENACNLDRLPVMEIGAEV
jgi:predicted acetyltransferase